ALPDFKGDFQKQMNKKIRVLSVGSLGKDGRISPFRWDQGEALRKGGLDVDYFNVREGGFKGYGKAYFALKRYLRLNEFDIIHAHYGLSGMIAVLQRKIPVVITFHGSDIWNPGVRFISRIASYLSAANIFISEALRKKAKGFRKKKAHIIPCGVNLDTFYPMDKKEAREKLGWDRNGIYILFSSSFDNPVKNYPLAKKVVDQIPGAQLIELAGYTREEVNLLMNAGDVLLITSFFESGPLVAKEALACNLPIVSTDVGNVRELIQNGENCFVVDGKVVSYLSTINRILERKDKGFFENHKESRLKTINTPNLSSVSLELLDVYQGILWKI
ncbi:MAG: glycosyltransferase family 4 protein, partial [bacterium]